jgi:NTP pyrophosphatase (non-canonical NTP hydrolase)
MMEVGELRDFAEWENRKRGIDIRKVAGGAEEQGFADAVIELFLLAQARGIDVEGAIEKRVEELRGKS